MTIQTTRRNLLKSAAAASALLVIGTRPDGTLAAGHAEATGLNPFVRINSDSSVTIIIKHFEMGQGTTTGLATLVAEELDADWDAVGYEFAPANDDLYKNLLFGIQGTGGSTAVANSYMQHRQAGAAAREVLVKAAAEAWGSDPASITIAKGVISDGSNSGSYADFAEAASGLTPSEEPPLKDPADFTLIGADHIQRKDTPEKIDGSGRFAMDVHLPDMVVAVIARPPRFGGVLASFDASAAADIPGFVDAKALPNNAGVAVYGQNTWAAFQARDAISVEWDNAQAETRSSAELTQALSEMVNADPEYTARPGSDFAATNAAIDGSETIIEQEFQFPALAHAPMEPLTCTIEPLPEGGVRIYDGCQMPGVVRPTMAQVLGVDPAQVEIQTLLAGGSFGRRGNAVSDYHVEAGLAFAVMGGQVPVKLVWSREDDLRGGYYRPPTAHKVRVGLDADGNITGWDHRIATKSLFKGTAFESVLVHDGVDHSSVEGVPDTHYAIPGMSVGLTDLQTPITALWWRSVGNTHTAYVMESVLDMVAAAAGRDPVEYRLGLLSGGDPDQQRLAAVLNLAAEKSGWSDPAPEGRTRGVALHKSFGSYVAEVAEISTDDSGAVQIEKITCAVDCGVPVNPDVIRAQMEGGIGYGLGAVMRNQISFTEGEPDQFNFPDYEPLRIGDIGAIEVHIVASAEAPSGVGEPGTPPAGPAVANAIAAATGTRVTSLPMTENGVSFA